MSLKGIVNTAQSLSFYLRQQEVTANNLANADTDGFKADLLAAHLLPGMKHAIPVEQTDFQQGSFRDTGRPLDLALDGAGFFVVHTDAGDRLTRGGSLRLDPVGRITDAHGNALLGEDGPILVSGTNVEVAGDGTVQVDGVVAGRLKVVDVADKTTLLKEEAGRYVPNGGLMAIDDGSTRVRQGGVEEPNLDPMLSMVDLVTIQRAYSANVDALKAMDGVLGTITGEVGKF